ncbi:aminoglycoside phosphotransferase family protein (plasmid) [Embleya sp. NBC_00888]|uniref:aminoglycoside phosphotransferase family protein n=1 Tax=Embleya sp. NBC_00888 TaxID=2975960 RepID=UPI002F912AEC|nr:aminoglycoside phosphotransferase family protein [Embleya sp. NBC_00888]
MSRIEATPLRGTTLAPAHLDALADALTTLHTAIPSPSLDAIAPPPWNPETALAKAVACTAEPPPPGLDPRVGRALTSGAAWLQTQHARRLHDMPPALGIADGNLANYLIDTGNRVHIVDYEDSGRSTRAFELAELLEHPSTWVDTHAFDPDRLVERLDLDPAEHEGLRRLRPLLAYLWTRMLLPGGLAHTRNPAGTLEQQAERLLALLDA